MHGFDVCYRHSEDIVARQIEDQFIIVPITGGLGDLEDVLFSMNTIGKAIWDMLDGRTSLNAVVDALIEDYEAEKEEIAADVSGFIGELLDKNLVVKA